MIIQQHNIWRDKRQVSRIIGALLTIAGGLVVAFESFFYMRLPPSDGFIRAEATVLSHEQRGTFREPAFSLTLQYRIKVENEPETQIRSGRRVQFEVYYALEDGETVMIEYNPHDPFEWRVTYHFSRSAINDYALGVIMITLGLFSITLPTIIRLASREDDFGKPIDEERSLQKEQMVEAYGDKIT